MPMVSIRIRLEEISGLLSSQTGLRVRGSGKGRAQSRPNQGRADTHHRPLRAAMPKAAIQHECQ